MAHWNAAFWFFLFCFNCDSRILIFLTGLVVRQYFSRAKTFYDAFHAIKRKCHIEGSMITAVWIYIADVSKFQILSLTWIKCWMLSKMDYWRLRTTEDTYQEVTYHFWRLRSTYIFWRIRTIYIIYIKYK
jgi:hypothetical protein